MESKRWILGLVFLIVAVAGLSIYGFNKNNSQNFKPQIAGETMPAYFSEDANVMYFYSDYCGWCLKQKEVLTKLGEQGYRVKRMNVGEKPELWDEYKIKGTPSFIAKNGDRLEGYQEETELKAWLDNHK